MGLFSSDDDGSSSGDKTFEPVTTDGNRVLGYLDDPDEDGLELVWIKDSKFRQLSAEEDIDRIVR